MTILFCLAAYIFGSLPTGYLFVRWRARKDIRTLGSRSTGATNVLRAAGWSAAVPVMVVDFAKGALPVVLGRLWFPENAVVPLAASLAAVGGHCFSFFLRFRGGKGVAASMGAAAGLGWIPFLICLATFAAVIALTRFVSLGSLAALSLYPFFRLALGLRDGILTWAWWIAILVVVVFRHRENILRIVSGTERKFGRKTEGAGQ